MRRWCVFLIAASVGAADCSRTGAGFPPLDDPFLRSYRGVEGGLYPGRSNTRPVAHEALGLREAGKVTPLDPNGSPVYIKPFGSRGMDTRRIVLLSLGMSNTTQEFSAFQEMLARDVEHNPWLVTVDGAEGGWSADRMVADPETYWSNVYARLRAAEVTAAQVQVVWMKQADSTPRLAFPENARALQKELRTIAVSLKQRLPNLRLVYLSSRIYGGYASSALNPEPQAYESGFAVKWLIEDQINGDPELSVDRGRAPWLGWGPYLWADGTRARYDGLSWSCQDMADDGTHPSLNGRIKVAWMLLDFFKTDTTARPWFVWSAGETASPRPSAVLSAASGFSDVATGSLATLYGRDLAPGIRSAEYAAPLPRTIAGVRVEVGGEPAPLYFVSPEQINFVVPPVLRSSEVVVVRYGLRSAPVALHAVMYAPGLFTLSGRPDGPVAARHADGRTVSRFAPASPGEVIELYGTGQGIRNPMLMMPELAPVVRIGGLTAEVRYAGPAGGWPGLLQVNVRVPEGVGPGEALPVDLRYGGFVSNVAALAVGGP
ncbi:MAG: hypothetical protein Q8N47_18040 [Bryobacterales bacterium]|nr:hypothetical protein [Bryobacterales bacterium]